MTFPVPLPRLAAVAAVLAVAVALWPGGVWAALVVVNVVLFGVALVDFWSAPRPDVVGFERELPAVLSIGGTGTVRWRLANPTGRRLHVEVADDLAPSLQAERRRARVVMPPESRVTATTTVRPRRRGRFRPAQVSVRVAGPLGLTARQATRSIPGDLRVHPPFHSREEAELRINRARLLDIGLRSAPGRGGGTEFDALREYTPDDEFRRLDWAATARAGKPIVRTYRAERNQTVLVLLDTGRVMAGTVAGVPRMEHALDATLMLTAVTSRLGDRAGLIAFDRDVRAVVAPRSGPAQLAAVTDALYDLEPRLVESDYPGAFVEARRRFRRRALLVVLSELAEQAIADTLLPALPVVARDHLVVVASVRDPDVAGWAAVVPTDAEGAYRKAAAVAALEERRRVTAQLRGIGVTVVDEAPGRLAPALADAYLRVKATGRL